ncbi:MAG TPA: TolC family protein [Gemmataceae bacterium]|nr:TolC family protein [Gemmataceae bacterium]
MPAVLTLGAVLELTMAANPDMQAAAARARIAEETLARARAEFFPTLGFNESFRISNSPLQRFSFLESENQLKPSDFFSGQTTADDFHSQVHFQQDLYNGGARLARHRSAEADREASRLDVAAVQNRIVFQVAEAYYRLYQARELGKVRREAVAQVESELRAAEARLRAQTAVRSDVLQIEVRLAEVREALIAVGHQEELAWAVLENVTGVRLAGHELPESLPAAPWSESSEAVEAAVAAAIESRPELDAAKLRQQSAQELVRAARAGNQPTLSAVADYDVFTSDFRSGADSFFVGVALGLKLFDGGRTRAGIRQAEARVAEIVAGNRRLQLDIELDVRRAYLQLKDARERLNVVTAAVSSARESLRQIESQYQNQSATVTQVIDAQVALSAARVRAANAHAEIEIARAALERAIGRLTLFLTPPESACPAHG